jgi:hypothetical protein
VSFFHRWNGWCVILSQLEWLVCHSFADGIAGVPFTKIRNSWYADGSMVCMPFSEEDSTGIHL